MSNGPRNRKWRVKAPGRFWDQLGKSSSGPTEKKNLNQDHVLEKPTQLAVVLFPRTPFLLFMTVIFVNYSDFICWPKKCETKINTIAFRLPRPPALTGYIVSNCLPTYDWFSEVLTRKPQIKQTTTGAWPEKSHFVDNSFQGFDKLWRVYSPSIFAQFAGNLACDFIHPLITKLSLIVLYQITLKRARTKVDRRTQHDLIISSH